MPLLLQIEPDEHSKLGIWQIEEDTEDLKWELQWGATDIKQFQALNDKFRGLHWLASRVLLRKMLDTTKFIDLQTDEFGKPHVKNFPCKISISHSGQRVAVLISNRECGVDIELMNKRIEALAPKFMAEEEIKYLGDEHTMEQMYIFWCAKEALYKLYGRKKLDFKENLSIYPFDYQDKGKIRGRIDRKDFLKELTIHYKRLDDYMLTYALDNPQKEIKPA